MENYYCFNFYINILFYYSLHLTLFCVGFRCTAQSVDMHILYEVFPLVTQVPTWHHGQSYHGVDSWESYWSDRTLSCLLKLSAHVRRLGGKKNSIGEKTISEFVCHYIDQINFWYFKIHHFRNWIKSIILLWYAENKVIWGQLIWGYQLLQMFNLCLIP